MPFTYLHHLLHCDATPLPALADRYGTPLYVYSAARIRQNYRRLAAAFAPLRPGIKYTLKANSNLAILRLLQEEGAGFDVVSGADLRRTLEIGADPASSVFTGIGKTDAELAYALQTGVGWFNAETVEELEALNQQAATLNKTATVALRLNPGVLPDTHPHIRTGAPEDKFGFPVEGARAVLLRAGDFPCLHFRGLHLHIGSQIPDPEDTLRAVEVALGLIQSFPELETLDIGGGYPVPYTPQDRYPPIEEFAVPIVQRLLQSPASRLHIHLEPGRYVVADAGALVLTVLADKQAADRRVVIVDGGMNVLLRPALYQATHPVLPVNLQSPQSNIQSDLAGPICESADYLARDVGLPRNLKRGDRVAVLYAGAYGMAMASNYNSQPLPAEVLVDGENHRLIRRRQTHADMIASEVML